MKNYRVTFQGKVIVLNEKSTAEMILNLHGGGLSETQTIKAMNAQRRLDENGSITLKTFKGLPVLFETIKE